VELKKISQDFKSAYIKIEKFAYKIFLTFTEMSKSRLITRGMMKICFSIVFIVACINAGAWETNHPTIGAVPGIDAHPVCKTLTTEVCSPNHGMAWAYTLPRADTIEADVRLDIFWAALQITGVQDNTGVDRTKPGIYVRHLALKGKWSETSSSSWIDGSDPE
jgi:hypothetical protein